MADGSTTKRPLTQFVTRFQIERVESRPGFVRLELLSKSLIPTSRNNDQWYEPFPNLRHDEQCSSFLLAAEEAEKLGKHLKDISIDFGRSYDSDRGY